MAVNLDFRPEDDERWYDMEEAFVVFGLIAFVALCAFVFWWVTP